MSLTIVAKCKDSDKHAEDVEFVTEWPFGGNFYSGGDDGKLKIWNRDLTLKHSQKLHEYRVYHAAFTHDSIYTCSNSPFIKEWTHLGPDGLVPKRQLEGHEDSVRKLRIGRTKLVSGGDDGQVRMWYTETGKCEAFMPVIEEVWDLKVDGDFIFTVRDRGISIWQTCEADQRSQHCGTLEARAPIALTPNTIYGLDKETSTKILGFKRGGQWEQIITIEASDRIIKAIALRDDVIYSGGYDKTLKAWDRKTNQLLASCEMEAEVSAIAAVGKSHVLVGLQGGSLVLLDFKKTA
ncbi:unnamed protein product [Cyprideis torosa]|uniref:Uncharacterized protein n=1 Tax=Cyprideis torosa TaxID=163714 RepID=A0A7R8W425_9CRUS|nr:unnamed protein product [Cyprideis torosa]CAG0882711.1 unnamed protein product [Cyprideis torosa]